MMAQELLQMTGALLIVLAMIGGTALCFRRFAKTGNFRTSPARELEVVESLMLDPKRRLVRVRHGASEHLILLGVQSELLIEASTRGNCNHGAQPPNTLSPIKNVVPEVRAA